MIFILCIHANFALENVTQEYELRHKWQRKDESRTSSWKPKLQKIEDYAIRRFIKEAVMADDW